MDRRAVFFRHPLCSLLDISTISQMAHPFSLLVQTSLLHGRCFCRREPAALFLSEIHRLFHKQLLVRKWCPNGTKSLAGSHHDLQIRSVRNPLRSRPLRQSACYTEGSNRSSRATISMVKFGGIEKGRAPLLSKMVSENPPTWSKIV